MLTSGGNRTLVFSLTFQIRYSRRTRRVTLPISILGKKNSSTDLDDFWYRNKRDPEEGHRLLFVGKIKRDVGK